MSGLRFAVALAFIAVAGTAHAQGTPQQRSACRGDVVRFCKGMGEDTGAIHGCLQSHYAKLRPACQKVLNGQG